MNVIHARPSRLNEQRRGDTATRRSTDHPLTLCLALMCVCSVAQWTGDVPEANRLVAMLLDHSSRHSLVYWQFWGRCLEVALARGSGELHIGRAVLGDPLCNPIHREVMATLNEGLVTKDAIARAENGLAGWCAAELLRVKAEILLRAGDGNSAVAEGLLQRSLEMAREQGALSWESRTATSLARLWHQQRRTGNAHDLLTSVLARFTEGFETTDLLKARTLLEDMAVS